MGSGKYDFTYEDDEKDCFKYSKSCFTCGSEIEALLTPDQDSEGSLHYSSLKMVVLLRKLVLSSASPIKVWQFG
jgi:hypothetical protein